MNFLKFSAVASAVLATTLTCLQPKVAHAGGEGFSQDIYRDTSKEVYRDTSKEVFDSKGDLGLGKFKAFPFHISVSVRGGYDDNVNLTAFDPRESWFTNVAVVGTYNFGSPRTRISLTTGGGFTYYFDRGDQLSGNTRDYDVNGFIGFTITHRATPRLTLGANIYASYQSVPDFQSFNNANFTFSRQSQNFFYTVNKFTLGYAWTPRFSTVTSYTLGYTSYDDPLVSQFQDRFEHIIGNEFRFLVWPTTTLVAEYRFGIVNYIEANNRDSTSHYFLGGFDHNFSPRFNISARAGVELRSYDSGLGGLGGFGGGDQTSPYVEMTLNYAIAQNTQLTWTNRYGIEESDVPELLSRMSYRTGLSLRHSFTPRITAGLNVAFQHDDYDGSLITPAFTDDTFDISLSVRYAINRNWAIDAGYTHTEVISGSLFREYARNRYYIGATFTF